MDQNEVQRERALRHPGRRPRVVARVRGRCGGERRVERGASFEDGGGVEDRREAATIPWCVKTPCVMRDFRESELQVIGGRNEVCEAGVGVEIPFNVLVHLPAGELHVVVKRAHPVGEDVHIRLHVRRRCLATVCACSKRESERQRERQRGREDESIARTHKKRPTVSSV